MKTKTKTSAKLIDEETIYEAAKYMSYDIYKTAHVNREDIYQEAYILLLGRWGKPFYSALKYATVDLTRTLYGRKDRMSEEDYQKRYDLEHVSNDKCVAEPKYDLTKRKGSYSKYYDELKLFAEKINYEEEFYALAHSELTDVKPYEQIMRNRRVKQTMAMRRLKEFKDKVKEHYDFDFFA